MTSPPGRAERPGNNVSEEAQDMARILVIEDDEFVRLTVSQALEHAGHVVANAANGDMGLKIFGEFQPDLVITDLVMPEKEGIETIVELRKLEPDLKIIAMSGGGRTKDMIFLDVAQQLGAYRALPKPFSIEALNSAVFDCLYPTEPNYDA